MYSTSAAAAARFLEYLETIQVPPPTSPVMGVACPAHLGGAAAAISPAGTCSAWSKTYCPNQEGAISISVLAVRLDERVVDGRHGRDRLVGHARVEQLG